MAAVNFSRRSWVSGFQSLFTAEELELAHVILSLASSKPKCFSFPSWASRRRRSVLLKPPPPPNPASSDAPKPEVTSPASPFAFFLSDSDAKSKQSTTKKTSQKRKKEEWESLVEERVQIQNTLLKEIEEAKINLRKLQDENSKLKHKLIHSTAQLEVSEKPGNSIMTGCPQSQVQPTVVNDILLPGPSKSTLQLLHPPSICNHQPAIDLNIPATDDDLVAPEQLQPLDHHHRIVMEMMRRNYENQAKAAAARQYRIQQLRSKKARRGRS